MLEWIQYICIYMVMLMIRSIVISIVSININGRIVFIVKLLQILLVLLIDKGLIWVSRQQLVVLNALLKKSTLEVSIHCVIYSITRKRLRTNKDKKMTMTGKKRQNTQERPSSQPDGKIITTWMHAYIQCKPYVGPMCLCIILCVSIPLVVRVITYYG